MSESVGSLLAEADGARDSKQWGTAAERYKRYLELRPKNSGVWVQYGHALKESGNLAGADGAYMEALRRRPREPDTYLQLGHLRKLQQRPSAALFWYRVVLGLAPHHGDAHREIEALEGQGIVATPERLPVPWISILISVLNRVRRQRASPLASANLAPRQANTDQRNLEPFETAWRQYLPSFMEATSNIAALGHEYARLRRDFEKRLSEQNAALRGEIARLRREIETMRSAATEKWTATRTLPAAAPLILDEARLEAARRNGALRLHLGLGEPRVGHIRVSSEGGPGVDIVAGVANLPFEQGTVAEIVACRVLENFGDDEVGRQLLPHWLTLLKPGGRVVITVPDAIAIAASAADGTISIDDYRAMLLGNRGRGDNNGLSLFSRDSLTALLKRSGFRNVEISASHHANGSSLDFEIHAYAPEAGHG